MARQGGKDAKLLVPAKYERPETSGLKATIRPGTEPMNFELTD
jgi:hypothetical protein